MSKIRFIFAVWFVLQTQCFLAADFYAGFTAFANNDIEVEPDFDTGRFKRRPSNSQAEIFFGQYNEARFPQLKDMTITIWRREGIIGNNSNILGTIISVLKKMANIQFPRPVSRIVVWIFTDGIETILKGNAYKNALSEIEILRKEAELYQIPVYCYVIESRSPKYGYTDCTNRQGYEVLKALSGDASNLFKLPDFNKPSSRVNELLDEIAVSNGEVACYFILDISPSLEGANPGIDFALNVINEKVQEKPKDNNKFVRVPAGEFIMGSDNYDADESPAHKRTIKAFHLGSTPVTEALYHSVMSSPEIAAKYKDSKKPMTNINYYNSVQFCNRLSEMERKPKAYRILEDGTVIRIPDAKGYRLPTEAEMQYAAYAGGSDIMPAISSEKFNLAGEVMDVGIFEPNAWGLYDMTGSVRQFTDDYYDVYRPETNFSPPAMGASKVCFGASFVDRQERFRLTYRFHHSPDFSDEYIGLRIALDE